MSNVRFMYVRDAKFEPIGCVAITINRGKNRAEYGLSMRNPIDAYDRCKRRVKFDKTYAQRLASGNMSYAAPRRVYIPSDATMHDISESVLKDIVARGEAPSSAVKFAKHWLRTTEICFG